MENNERYKLLAEGESLLPSNMGIIPASKNFNFSGDSILDSLKRNKYFKLLSFDKVEDEDDSFAAEIEYQEEEFNIRLYIASTDEIGLSDFGFANQIAKSDFDNALLQPNYLEVSMFFGESVINSFHLQLKVMDAIVPDASLVVDFMSFRLLSAKWLKMTAKSPIPPSPDYLFTLHGVYNDKGPKTQYWFHTHGLLRCKSIDLEVMGVSSGPEQMNDLINMVVKKFIKDPTKEKEKFQIGYDGLGLNLAWLRWEEAIKDFPNDMLGGANDREGEHNVHSNPSGILFAVEDNLLVSPEIFVKTLADNPIFYISNEETQRMSDLAKERFTFFKDMFDKYTIKPKSKSFLSKMFGNKNEETPEPWDFLVKLGLSVDDDDAGSEKEHLWFRVRNIEGSNIEGELLNQPYWISGLNAGDVNVYSSELLTDWLIYSPEGGSYSTDTIYQLGYT